MQWSIHGGTRERLCKPPASKLQRFRLKGIRDVLYLSSI